MPYTPYQRPSRLRRATNRFTKLVTGLLTVLAGVLLLLGTTLLFAVPTFVAWNLGVVGVVHATGGHVQHVSLWTALGVSFGISVLSRLFHQPSLQVDKRE